MSSDSQNQEGYSYDEGNGSDSSPSQSRENTPGSPPLVQQIEERRRKGKFSAGASAPIGNEVNPRGGAPPSSSSGKNTPSKKKGKKADEGGGKTVPRAVRSSDGSPTKSTTETVGSLNLPAPVEFIIPTRRSRPWMVPEGFLCVYETFFREGRLFLPFPRPLIDFCVRKEIALAQLTPFAILNLVGLMTFGAEGNTTIDADFLEKSVTLVTNPGTPGTFYTHNAGGSYVTKKPSKASGDGKKGEWQDYYFFIRATPEVVGDGAPELRTKWNRELGVTRKDGRIGNDSDGHEKIIARMLEGVERAYPLLTHTRVEE